ncbi:RimJ/RimL family protein N-acetyltransferase [Agromyces hippuratus]|uniref:RimJ/RimL family protein N-acetyltransferase n=1 Tax=Agromyces hippuratus TaxID=286438 RepID=A0A852X5K5_9MICO|nr:GNAT family protein [Agromyces hippuratus]NYG22804.1 RimJ/RimL family protein N-acetyltransferase [Agromyces hippuratus]
MTTSDVQWPRPAGPLTLRQPTDADLDQILEWRNTPEVTRWLIRTEVEPRAFRKTWLDGAGDPNDHSAVAVLGDEVVGTGALWITDAMGQSHIDDGPWRRAEAGIGYILDPAHAGNGYATEIARALLDLAFGDLGVHRVTAGCFADNTASWRIMEKLGMRREQHGVRDSWHAELGWVDGYTYAMLAEEWRAAR